MLDLIRGADIELFLFLNGLHADFLDPIMIWISGKYEWIPLYILLLIMIGRKVGWKKLIVILPFIVVLIVLTDQSSVLCKNFFERLRPSHNPLIMGNVHTVNDYMGGQFGFVSSHAANTFGFAIFVGSLLQSFYNRILLMLVIWASLVAYSRIYLGVHYPLDIIMGALLGGLIAYFWHRIYEQLMRKLKTSKQ